MLCIDLQSAHACKEIVGEVDKSGGNYYSLKGNVWNLDFTIVSGRTSDRKLKLHTQQQCNALRYLETLTHAQSLALIQNMKVVSRVTSLASKFIISEIQLN